MRAFIAIALDQNIIQHLANIQKPLRSEFPQVKWVDEKNFHLTLKFLGHPQTQENKLKKALTEAAAQVAPFDLTLSTGGCFPEQDPVRTIWIATKDPSNMLFRLQQECERIFSTFENTTENFTKQKKFLPHITLGRISDKVVKGPLRKKISQLSIEPLHQRVTEIVLYNSTLSKEGPKYEIILKSPLTATILS